MLPFKHLVLRLLSFLLLSQANALTKTASPLTKETLKKWADSHHACTFIVDCYSVTIRSPSCDTGRLARRGPDYILAFLVRDCTGIYHEHSRIQWQFVYPRKPPGRLTRCSNQQTCELHGEHLNPGKKYHVQASIWIPRAQKNLNLTFDLVSHTGGGRRLHSSRKIVARKGVEDSFIGYVHKSGETTDRSSPHVNKRQKDMLQHNIHRRHTSNWIKRKQYSKYHRRNVNISNKLSSKRLPKQNLKQKSPHRQNNMENRYVTKCYKRSKRGLITIYLDDTNVKNNKRRDTRVKEQGPTNHNRKYSKSKKWKKIKRKSTYKRGKKSLRKRKSTNKRRKKTLRKKKSTKKRGKKTLRKRKSTNKRRKNSLRKRKRSRSKKGQKIKRKSTNKRGKKTLRKRKRSRSKKGQKIKRKSTNKRGKKTSRRKHTNSQGRTKNKSKFEETNFFYLKRRYRKGKYSKTSKRKVRKGKVSKTSRKELRNCKDRKLSMSKKKSCKDQKQSMGKKKQSGAISINEFLKLKPSYVSNITEKKDELVNSILKTKGSIIDSSPNTTGKIMHSKSKTMPNSTISPNKTNEYILVMLRKDVTKLLNLFNLSRSEIKNLEQRLKEKAKEKEIKGDNKGAKFTNMQSGDAFAKVYQRLYNMTYNASKEAIKSELGLIQRHMASIQKNMEKFQSWRPWAKWTACPKSCTRGQGFRMRERKCIHRKGCVGKSIQFAPCQKDCKEYERWTSWAKWSTCSHSCGTGITVRKRLCKVINPGCEGQSYQIEPCTISPTCPAAPPTLAAPRALAAPHAIAAPHAEAVPRHWGQWSECSVTCGIGHVFRQRYCNQRQRKHCRGPMKQQTQACVMDSCIIGVRRQQLQILEGADAVLRCNLQTALEGPSYWITPFGEKISKHGGKKRFVTVVDKLLIRETQRKDKGVYHCVTRFGQTADIEIDVLWCGKDLCQNGGTCHKKRPRLNRHHRRSKCVCKSGFRGMFCEQEKPVEFMYMVIVSVTTLVSSIVLMIIIMIFVHHRRKIKKLKKEVKRKGPDHKRKGYQKLADDDQGNTTTNSNRDHNVSVVSNDNSLMEIREEDFKHFKKQNSYNMYRTGQDMGRDGQSFDVDQVGDGRYISIEKERGRMQEGGGSQGFDMDQVSDGRYIRDEKERGRMQEGGGSRSFDVDQVGNGRYIRVENERGRMQEGGGRQSFDVDQVGEKRYISVEKERGRMHEPALSIEMKEEHIQPPSDFVEDYPMDPMDDWYFIEDYPDYEVPNPSENPTEWDRIYDTVEKEEHFYENFMKENENKGDNLDKIDNDAVSMNEENIIARSRQKSVNFSEIYDDSASHVNKSVDLKLSFNLEDDYDGNVIYLEMQREASPKSANKQGIYQGGMSDAQSQGRQFHKSSPSIDDQHFENFEIFHESVNPSFIEENDKFNHSNVSRKLSFGDPDYSSTDSRVKRGTKAIKETLNEIDRQIQNTEDQDQFIVGQNGIVGHDDINIRLVHRKTFSKSDDALAHDLPNLLEVDVNDGLCYTSPGHIPSNNHREGNSSLTLKSLHTSEYSDEIVYTPPMKNKVTMPKKSNNRTSPKEKEEGLHEQKYQLTVTMETGDDVVDLPYLTSTPKKDESTANQYEQVIVDDDVSFHHKNLYPIREISNHEVRETFSSEELDGLFQCIVQESDDTDQEADVNSNYHQRTLSPIQEDEDYGSVVEDEVEFSCKDEISASFKSISPSISERRLSEGLYTDSPHTAVPELSLGPDEERTVVYISDQYSASSTPGSTSGSTDIVANFESPPLPY